MRPDSTPFFSLFESLIMRRTCFCFAITLALALGIFPSVQTVHAQEVDAWTAHTSFGGAIDLTLTSTHTWVATSGGIYSVEHTSGSISRLTVVNGLASVGASAIAADEIRSLIWVGYDTGLLDRIDTKTGVITTYRDIERADQFSDRGINRIRIQGDSLMIATEFGIVVFDPLKSEVRDSYSRLGNLPVAAAVQDVLIDTSVAGVETIWAATAEGIARAPLHGVNLKDPGSWTTENIPGGTNSPAVLALAQVAGVLYAGTESDVYARSGPGSYQKLGLTGRPVAQMAANSEYIVATSQFNLLVIRPSGFHTAHAVEGILFPVASQLDGAGRLWIVDASSGLGTGNIPTESTGTAVLDSIILPSGPADGLFSLISIGDTGEVWLSGVNAPNTGFYKLDTVGEWTTYSTVTIPELEGKAAYVHVYAASDGTGWAGSEGAGVASVSPEGEVITYGESNSSLEPAPGGGSFIVLGGLHEDNLGNMWFSTRASGRPLHLRMSSGAWTSFGPKVGQGLLSSSTAYGRIFIDSFDQKWIIIHNEANFRTKKGVMVLETGIPENVGDDEFQFFGTKGGAGQGLPSIEVNAVVEDKDGLIWIGTESGPAYFINTGIVARDQSAIAIWPQWADRSNGTFLLFSLNIHDMAVDPAGRIWFATDDGAWLAQAVEGGYEQVYHFTTENSPLFSNEVLAVAVDDDSGEVYFSTDRGLISFSSDAIAPVNKVVDLKIFPNPVRISGDQAPEVFIEGLVPATSIRIVTPAGYIVRRLEARGGRIRWDARDENGNLVSSGVYLIIAVGQNDEGTAYGKIAVIR